MLKPKEIELLSPAKDIATAKEAILHGADAIYIGAPKFSARSSAGNSIQEIAQLVEFAHIYGVKIYVAINTIIKESELPEVEALITGLYRASVDAIIIQDLGILKLNIPPIAIHASTQCNSQTPQKVGFLQQLGVTQVVLARELTIPQIAQIHKQCSVPLEVFIHGALCVSYSGNCYLSEATKKRSANRGECAQCCRLKYNLKDTQGNILIKNMHLLSLKDMNRTQNLQELLEAGVTSLKIEGRLKSVDYVKNITAHYRKELDKIIANNPQYARSSKGESQIDFTPNPSKSFNRGFTTYLPNQQEFSDIASPNTPKSMGEEIGRVTSISPKSLTINTTKKLNNGDGFIYTVKQGGEFGFRVDRAEGNIIYPTNMPTIDRGAVIYRNHDAEFDRELSRPTAQRRVAIDITLSYANNTLTLMLAYPQGVTIYKTEEIGVLQEAQNPQAENQRKQLSKLGNTPYKAAQVDLNGTESYFIPSSILTRLRQDATALLTESVIANYKPQLRGEYKPTQYPATTITYKDNVINSKAQQLYRECGVDTIEPAFELAHQSDAELMTTKYCIKKQYGECPKIAPNSRWGNTLFLESQDANLQLTFNCKECIMIIKRV